MCTPDNPNTMGVCVTLTEPVNGAALRESAERLRERFPYFYVRVKHEDNELSNRISKDLKKSGFKYVGAITIYSHLQACGIINDHDKDCPCGQRINETYPTIRKWRDHEVK